MLISSHQTPPTPDVQTPVSEHPYSPLDKPMPPPVPLHYPKWIHRRLWAREDIGRGTPRNLFPSDVMACPRSKGDRNAPSLLPECIGKQRPSWVTMQQTQQQDRLARSCSVSTSIASTMSSSTVTKCQLTPKKSILSSRTSVSRRQSKHGRSRSASTPSVKFADAPTYYHDNEYKYAYDEGDEDEECTPLTPSSTTPCISHLSLSPKDSAARVRPSSSKVRQALVRFIPSITQRPPERPSISGPYPLWKEKDADTGSIRSVRSAPASRDKAKTFWGRMMACTAQ